MKDYTKFMQWALFTITDRKTQDDRKSKIRVEALFSSPWQRDYFDCPNKEYKHYMLPVDELGRFEQFYNFVQDINAEYGYYSISHLNDGDFTDYELQKFRHMLDLWTDTKIKHRN